MNKKSKALSYLINLFFFVYFLLLLVERVLSVIFSYSDKKVSLYGSAFHGYVYTVVFLSIGAFFVYLFLRCRKNIKALVKVNTELDYRDICIASGILLLSGMVHTEYTISGLQFASYGVLILGIILRVIEMQKVYKRRALSYMSLIYLVAFSMAIPVMYPSQIDLHVFFHVLEAIASIGLVATFTYLMVLLFSGKDDLFLYWPIALVLALDIPLIILRWNEEINFFVLIFLILSFVLFLVGFIYKNVHKEK
ncbi:MAG: hypothetical protein K5694_02135 [Bacilli bacterium]|nr:hypothetical protein [Bacilli bacterium]